MCGIFAIEITNSSKTHIARAYVWGMLQAMRYRGPDKQAVLKAGPLMMGFARLSIIDHDNPAAEQPYFDGNQRVTVFNGEIYNYKQLDQYAKSEVALLSDMIDAGVDLRQYLDGEYAIVSINRSSQKATLYRDRFGICPLYYQTRPFFAVSSEARRLSRAREVPAHGRVEIDLARRRVRVDAIRYYGATSDNALRPAALADYVVEAVHSRIAHSDVPVALALSGGLDSSVIAAALPGLTCKDGSGVSAVAVGFSEDSLDLRSALSVARAFKIPLKTIRITADSIDPAEQRDIITHLDCKPEQATSLRYQHALRSWFVAKHASARVLLCGDGPDELIGGYPPHTRIAEEDKPEWRITQKRLSTLRSMQHFNNDRTNKMGMAHSKEYRSPLLASTISQVLLAERYQERKAVMRSLAEYLGVPREVCEREHKYSPDETRIKVPSL